jgi:hypothetical protein
MKCIQTLLLISFWPLHQAALVFNNDIRRWDTGLVTDTHFMFVSAFQFDVNITGWNTPLLVDFTDMFGANWLANYKRIDGRVTFDGPPNAWMSME